MKYTESHEWIVVENGVGTVGITSHAQKELGEVVYVELPKVGKDVKAGEEVAVLESTKAAADIYAPVSGKILAVNEALKQGCSDINQMPETMGWLFKIALSKPADLEQLLDKREYLNLIE
jgi:glycine cleavage system H protein